MSFAFDAADDLLGCLDASLTAAGNKPAMVCVRVGEVPYDAGLSQDECCAGLAWVRIVSITPSVQFPQPDFNAQDCISSSYAVELEMGVLRCHAFGTVNSGPTCDQWTAEALQVDTDASSMRSAVCCFGQTLMSEQWVQGAWEPIGAEGGCIGGKMTVTALIECGECADA